MSGRKNDHRVISNHFYHKYAEESCNVDEDNGWYNHTDLPFQRHVLTPNSLKCFKYHWVLPWIVRSHIEVNMKMKRFHRPTRWVNIQLSCFSDVASEKNRIGLMEMLINTFVFYNLVSMCKSILICYNDLFSSERSPEEVNGILSAFSTAAVKGPFRRVTVSRRRVWQCSSQWFGLPNIAFRTGEIIVKFQQDNDCETEPSADLGGPRREFFRLLLEEIQRCSGMFSRGEQNRFSMACKQNPSVVVQ